ncbi:MAG: hypothetical protein ACTHNO_02700 [Ralstonia sp.]|uniref:hypothetical protein n=1 Tax=Ralstonia sp. TaxID=54061 RepID=UPI003F8138BC
MAKIGVLKRWYSVSEAAARLSATFSEPVSAQDVIDLINEGQIKEVWWDADGAYAVPVAPGVRICALDEDPWQRACSHKGKHWWYGHETLLDSAEAIGVLSGMMRVHTEPRDDWFSLPYSPDKAEIKFVHGVLLVDQEGGLWRLVRYVGEGRPTYDAADFAPRDDGPSKETLKIHRDYLAQFEAQFSDGSADSDAVLDSLQAQMAAEPRVGSTRSEGSWPWGNHETKLLSALANAGKQWWGTYDPEDNTTAPTNNQVSQWLKDEHGIADRLAAVMAQILRADGIPQGPRRK